MQITTFSAPPRCCSCLDQPAKYIRIVHVDGSRHPEAGSFDFTTTFSLPICSACALRIALVKGVLLAIFSAFIAVGALLATPEGPLDWLIGLGVAGLIVFVLFLGFNMFDPATWFRGRFQFANREYLRLFRDANPGIAAEAKPPYEDGIFLIVLPTCVIASALLGASAVDLLQQGLAPVDAFLLGQTPVGSLLVLVPAIVLCMLPAAMLAMHLSEWIHRLLRLAPVEPPAASVWAAAWAARAGWGGTAAIAVALLVAIAVVGLRSYFYATDTGLSVRSPLEASLRHYRWDDVAVVFLACRSSREGMQFRYVLRMSDGNEVDFLRVPVSRLAPVLDRIGASLETISGVRYQFDIDESALADLGARHGVSIADAVRDQARKHGGMVQR